MQKEELTIGVKILDIEPFKKLIKNLKDLNNQIEISNFVDGNGMRLKNNTAYIKFKDTIDAICNAKEAHE